VNRYKHAAANVLAAICLHALTACGSDNANPVGHQSQGFAPPPFPDARAAAASQTLQVEGTDAIEQSSRCVPHDPSLHILSFDNECHWAIYQLDIGDDLPVSLTVQLDPNDTDIAWIGLADFQTGRWSFQGPLDTAGAAGPLALSGAPLEADDLRYVSPGNSIFVAVLVAGNHAAMVQSVQVNVVDLPLPPQASFEADPQQGLAGDPVTLDASGSADPDGDIVSYEWDLDGDGSFESNGGLGTVLTTSLPTPGGTVDVGLRVTDSWGLTGISTLTLTATTVTWDRNTIGAGSDCAAAVVLGNPAVCYVQNHVLLYSRALFPDGSSWGTPVSLDGTSGYNQGLSLAVIGGNPSIAYGTNLGLRYIAAVNPTGSAWNLPTTVTPFGGENPSLLEVSGKPAIAHVDFAGDWGLPSKLYYSRANNALGTSWVPEQSIHPAEDVNSGPTLLSVSGRPAVGYSANTGLQFLRATDADGAAWGAPQLVAADGQTWCTMCLVQGNPAMCFVPGTNSGLRFTRANSADGATWAAPIVMIDRGTTPSMTIVNGKPALSFFDPLGSDLSYLAALDTFGSAWGAPLTLDANGDVGYTNKLIEVGGSPAIAYAASGPEVRYVSGF
jgi:hypothetical protein